MKSKSKQLIAIPAKSLIFSYALREEKFGVRDYYLDFFTRREAADFTAILVTLDEKHYSIVGVTPNKCVSELIGEIVAKDARSMSTVYIEGPRSLSIAYAIRASRQEYRNSHICDLHIQHSRSTVITTPTVRYTYS